MSRNRSPEKPVQTRKKKRLAEALWSVFLILDKNSVRSSGKVIIHGLIAVALAVVLHFGQFAGGAIDDSSLVIILAAIVAVSGAMFAVSVALGIFSSQYYTDWTYRSRERLRNQLEKLEDGMEKWVGKYPGIPERLVELFKLMAMYIPGQRVDFDEVGESDKVFANWVKEELEKSGKGIDFGTIGGYESFEKYAFDASLVVEESKDVLMEIGLAEWYGRTLNTLPPVTGTWALVLVYSLVFAIIGRLDIMSDNMNLAILIVPMYLCFLAGSAVVIDYAALIRHMRARERGYEMGKSAFMQQHGLGKHK